MHASQLAKMLFSYIILPLHPLPLILTFPPSIPPDVESRLSINDLGDVLEAAFAARSKSFKIGLRLKVPVDTLDTIAAQFDDLGDKLQETLKVWLRTATQPTWQAILVALRSPVVGELSLATNIEAKYCTPITPEAQLPQQPTPRESDPVQILHQALRDSQLQTERLKYQVEEKRHTMDARETQLIQQLQTLEQDLQQHKLTNHKLRAANDQLRQELHQVTAQPQETILQLKRQLQQTRQQVEEMQHTIGARETQLQKLNQDLLQHKHTIQELQAANDRLRQELQQAMEKKQALESQLTEQLQRPPSIAVTQQKTIRDMKWKKKSKVPEKMYRGSAASDSNMAYINGSDSTKVYSYDSDTQKWRQLPNTPHINTTLVVVQHILTMVGGYVRGKATNSLLSLMGEGRAMKWLPHYPAMLTARCYTAAVCSGHSLIVAGGQGDGSNRLATVEVLDIDTKQWSTACSLPHPFSEATISICRERLYLIGGCDETGLTHSVLTCSVPELLQSQTEKLRTEPEPDRQTTKWRRIADAPSSLSSCATLCGQLVAVGGWKDLENTSAIFVYKETTDSWEAMGDMPTARRLALVAILNGKLMVVGGGVGGWRLGWLGPATDVVEILC